MVLIDSLKFSRDKQSLRGSLPVSGFERLRDSLFSATLEAGSTASLDYEVSGGADAPDVRDVRERPIIRLKVTGRLPLQCQRCLGALDYGLAVNSILRLVPEASLDAEQSDDPDEPDCIAASAELDLAALIEDEILLALPAFPRHEEGSCGSGDGRVVDAKVSAFSALSKLGALKQKEFKSKE